MIRMIASRLFIGMAVVAMIAPPETVRAESPQARQVRAAQRALQRALLRSTFPSAVRAPRASIRVSDLKRYARQQAQRQLDAYRRIQRRIIQEQRKNYRENADLAQRRADQARQNNQRRFRREGDLGPREKTPDELAAERRQENLRRQIERAESLSAEQRNRLAESWIGTGKRLQSRRELLGAEDYYRAALQIADGEVHAAAQEAIKSIGA